MRMAAASILMSRAPVEGFDLTWKDLKNQRMFNRNRPNIR